MSNQEKLPVCVEIHTILQENIRFQCEILKDLKKDITEIKNTLKEHNNRLWSLYLKVVLIAAFGGSTAAGIMKMFG